MKTIICFAVVVVLALLSAVLVSVDLALAWVVSWFLIRNEKQAVGAALLAGLLIDLFSFGRVGTNSIGFLCALLVLATTMRLQRPLSFLLMMPLLTGIFLFFTWFTAFLTWHTVSFYIPWWRLVGDIAAVILFLFIFVYFIGTRDKEPLRLKV